MVFVPYMAHTSSDVAYRTYSSFLFSYLCPKYYDFGFYLSADSNLKYFRFLRFYVLTLFAEESQTSHIRHAVTFHLFQLLPCQLIYTQFHIFQPPRLHSPFTCHIASTLIGVHSISPSTEGRLHHFQEQTCLQNASSWMFFFSCEPRVLRFIFMLQIVWKCTYILTEGVFVYWRRVFDSVNDVFWIYLPICSALTFWQLDMPVNSFFCQHKILYLTQAPPPNIFACA